MLHNHYKGKVIAIKHDSGIRQGSYDTGKI